MPEAGEARYHLTVREDVRHRVSVQAELTLREGTLRMASWGHPYLPRGWATFVRSLRVVDAAGKPVEARPDTSDDSWGAWIVNAPEGTRLRLSYEVELSHDAHDWNAAGGQDSRPALAGGALVLVTKALFVYSPGSSERR